ncbi:hypothetical protein E3N88_22713 [Mikania micrantha]|uniref:P-type ATPase C-terminal domain-containing protein n=1 Tax=Mikania micrantha TaxID=192012 RepID=A0A5N6NB88_9ASTR|nr:hypothetical protein E3N88_22713 [Mikania micrantha]
MLERVSDMMEKDLILVGATVVEDKLQQGVPQCIDKLVQAGLKIWVLTGDKMETAINIEFACSLLRQGMKQIRISTNVDMLNQDSKRAVKENIVIQMTNASQMIKLEKDPHAAFVLIIDGKTLTYALEEDLKHEFLKLAVDCASVICCRVSPKQKAMVRSFNSYERIFWKRLSNFVEALAPAPLFWLTTILVTVACNLQYLAHISFQRSKAKQETKNGFTARVDAKIRLFRQMLQKKLSVLSPRVALAATKT